MAVNVPQIGLPPIVKPSITPDLGFRQNLRDQRALGLQERQLDLQEQRFEESKKQSSLSQLIDLQKERRQLAKDAFAQSRTKVNDLFNRLVSLPEEQAKQELNTLLQKPDSRKVLGQIGTTPDQILARIKETKKPAKLKEAKTTADLVKVFDGVDQFLESGNVQDLVIKEQPDGLALKAPIEMVKSLRQAHRVNTNALLRNLEFADETEKQDILNQIQGNNDNLLDKTREILKMNVKAEVKDNISEDDLDGVMDKVINKAVELGSLDAATQFLGREDTQGALAALGLDPEIVREAIELKFDSEKRASDPSQNTRSVPTNPEPLKPTSSFQSRFTLPKFFVNSEERDRRR